jgi:hypothetical protein
MARLLVPEQQNYSRNRTPCGAYLITKPLPSLSSLRDSLSSSRVATSRSRTRGGAEASARAATSRRRRLPADGGGSLPLLDSSVQSYPLHPSYLCVFPVVREGAALLRRPSASSPAAALARERRGIPRPPVTAPVATPAERAVASVWSPSARIRERWRRLQCRGSNGYPGKRCTRLPRKPVRAHMAQSPRRVRSRRHPPVSYEPPRVHPSPRRGSGTVHLAMIEVSASDLLAMCCDFLSTVPTADHDLVILVTDISIGSSRLSNQCSGFRHSGSSVDGDGKLFR